MMFYDWKDGVILQQIRLQFQKYSSLKEFDTVCTVHRNQLYKQTNKMHFLYVFILQVLYNSTCFERPFRSSSGVHYLLYSAALYKPCKRV